MTIPSDNPASRKQSCFDGLKPCPVYTCTSCDRDLIVLVGDAPADDRCHRCRMLPGWHTRPEVVALCDFDQQQLAATAELAEDGRALQ